MQNKILLVVLLFLCFINVVYAKELDLGSEKYIIYNMNDNRILDENNSHDETSIASLTKIMTVIVAIEHIDNYDEKVTITDSMLNDIDWDVAKVGFKEGETLSYNDLLYGAILASGADAVNALAISVSGNKEDFVKLMNDKVSELGLKNTHFQNVVGLYSESNYSSAYDMAQILIYALKNDKFKEVFEKRNYTFSNGKKTRSTIEIYNGGGNNISYITGSKTGYIKKAGYCLASTARMNDVNYLMITLNNYSKEKNSYIKDHIKSYNYYNNNYGYKELVNSEDVIVTLKTKYAKEKEVNIKSGVTYNYYLKNDYDKKNVKYEYDGPNMVSYFRNKGTRLGHVKIRYNDEILKEYDLIYNEELTFDLESYILTNKTRILILLIVLFLIILVKVVKDKNEKKIETI